MVPGDLVGKAKAKVEDTLEDLERLPGDAESDDASDAQAGRSKRNGRKSTHDNKLVSGDATNNDPAQGTLREDELD